MQISKFSKYTENTAFSLSVLLTLVKYLPLKNKADVSEILCGKKHLLKPGFIFV